MTGKAAAVSPLAGTEIGVLERRLHLEVFGRTDHHPVIVPGQLEVGLGDVLEVEDEDEGRALQPDVARDPFADGDFDVELLVGPRGGGARQEGQQEGGDEPREGA